VRGTLDGGALGGVDPRQQDVTVRVADGAGDTLVCCTIASEHWMRMYARVWGFWDRRARICPPLNDLAFGSNRRGRASFHLIAKRLDLSGVAGPTLGVTIGAEGGQCARGEADLRSVPRGYVLP